MSDLITVPFRGATLSLTEVDGVPYTSMKPIVEGMGLDWSAQYKKLQENSARWGIAVIAIPTEGGRQDALCLPLRKLPGWLMTLQPTRVNPALRDGIIAYQTECDDVLWAYWTGGRKPQQEAASREPAKTVQPSAPETIMVALSKDEYIAHLEGKFGYSARVAPPASTLASVATPAPVAIPAPAWRAMSPEEDAHVVALHRAGWRTNDIARAVGRSRRSIGRALKRATQSEAQS